MIHPEARKNVPTEGPAILKRICAARMKCTYHCGHRKPHIVGILCCIKCCDVEGKDVRCVAI